MGSQNLIYEMYLIEFYPRFIQGADRNGFVKFVWLNLIRLSYNRFW